MTFQNAPWAIDGALLNSALARRAEFAATSGASGIVQRDDLKVTQLDTPGVGVQIAPGVGLVLNEYQSNPNETYVTSNPGVHVIPSGEMPASNPSAKSYILAVVVGDPDFSQVGHPWMGAGDPPVGEETTFQYVRPTLIEVSAGATDIPGPFPALPLARIDIPANTTTITNAMIFDLRQIANPRTERQIFMGQPTPGANVTSAVFANWTDVAPSVKVPAWATRAKIIVQVSSALHLDPDVQGYVRAKIGSIVGPSVVYAFDDSSGGADRQNLMMTIDADVTSIAGTDQTLRTEASRLSGTGVLSTYAGQVHVFDVSFSESIV